MNEEEKSTVPVVPAAAPKPKRTRRAAVPKYEPPGLFTRALALAGWLLSAWAIRRRMAGRKGKKSVPPFSVVFKNTVIGYVPEAAVEAAEALRGLPPPGGQKALTGAPGASENGAKGTGHYF